MIARSFVSCVLLICGSAAAQAPAEAPPITIERVQPRSQIRGLTVQRAAPEMHCDKPDPVDCAETDEQRRALLLSSSWRKLSDEQVLRLIEGLKDVDAPFPDRRTPLTTMIAAGRPKAVVALLKKGANPVAQDASGRLLLNQAIEDAFVSVSGGSALRPEVRDALNAALGQAARSGRLGDRPALDATLVFRENNQVDMELLSLLLQYGADPLFKGRNGRPLDIASRRPDVVRRLVTAKTKVDPAELDRRAYVALAEGKPELAEALGAGGADPARYVRGNPDALYDALQRPAPVLELVLKAGADPNASRSAQFRTVPLLQVGFDLDKMRLLLKYGADPNAKDSSHYTVLATVLFSGSMKAPKIELVRLLVGAGANVNGDHGGWGRAGALGLAKREDTDVIAFLIERGATLSEQGKGPLTIAIGMERDDLALALLRRDRKLDPLDRQALPLAARRGWNEVVTALITAGAEIDARDAQGMTALALAERRRNTAMTKALVAAGARPGAAPARPSLPPGADFHTVAARAIDDVAFFDPPRFSLEPGPDGPFAFYGTTTNRFEEVQCERNAGFQFITSANVSGGIRVGVCAKEAARVRELAQASRGVLESLLGQFSQASVKTDQAMLAKFGWKYAKNVSETGAEEHYFALIAIGHGVLSAPTLVLVPRAGRPAVVVQAETMQLCEGFGLGSQTPLCSDPRQALTDIARRLEARYAK